MRSQRGGDRSGITLGAAFCVLVALAAGGALAGPFQNKKKEDQTQTLQLPKELPGAVEADTRRLVFYVTPLSAKGLLSQQIRDAVKALLRRAGGDTILKIRAFVAGPGDVRRVRDLVSGVFTERQKPLPALSLIRSGGLPLEGAQIVLEAIAESRKPLKQAGLAFVSAQPAMSANPLDPVEPLMVQSLGSLRQAVHAAGAAPGDVARVTCFVSSFENLKVWRALVEGEYPRAAVDYVQPQRAPGWALAACEAVARLSADPGPLRMLSAEGAAPDHGQSDKGQSQIALVGARRLVLTGTQVSFGFEEKDAHLAFERLQRELEHSGSSMRNVAFAHYYPLAQSIAAQVRRARRDFFDAAHPPAGSLLVFEGLTSMDAGFAMDVVAVK
jgi:enamine deaminase RidA (YjgF/YER057c/UK114 family)